MNFVNNLFPKTAQELIDRSAVMIENFTASMQTILGSEFDSTEAAVNTMRDVDNIVYEFRKLRRLLMAIEMVYPDMEMKQTAANIKNKVENVDNLLVVTNKNLYNLFRKIREICNDTEMTNEDKYYLENELNTMNREGLNLPDDRLMEIMELKNAINIYGSQFMNNIVTPQNSCCLTATQNELTGLSKSFLNNFKQDDDMYKIILDWPTYSYIAENCDNGSTREKALTIINSLAKQ